MEWVDFGLILLTAFGVWWRTRPGKPVKVPPPVQTLLSTPPVKCSPGRDLLRKRLIERGHRHN